jgi:prophage regulatory protein
MNSNEYQLRAERMPQVLSRTGLTRSILFAKINAGDFPKPIKISARATAFMSHEVDAWLVARAAARPPQRAT